MDYNISYTEYVKTPYQNNLVANKEYAVKYYIPSFKRITVYGKTFTYPQQKWNELYAKYKNTNGNTITFEYSDKLIYININTIKYIKQIPINTPHRTVLKSIFGDYTKPHLGGSRRKIARKRTKYTKHI